METTRRRYLLRTAAIGCVVSLTGCINGDIRRLNAICAPQCESEDRCPRNTDPLPSDDVPLATIATLQQLLDTALEEFSYPDCERGEHVRMDEPVDGETWDEIEEVFEELPHGDVLHEGNVIPVVLDIGTEPGEHLPK